MKKSVDFEKVFLAFKDFNLVPLQYTIDFIKGSGAVKFSEDDDKIVVVTKESSADVAITRLAQIHKNKKLENICVKDSIFEEFIGKYIDNDIKDYAHSDIQKNNFSLDEVSSSSVINVINSLFLEAFRQNASDIHIEPKYDCVKIRFRLDGVLKTARVLRFNYYKPIVNRLKVMANMNIMESRLPQDGHIEVKVEDALLDVRFSSVPVQYGESIVLRLFNMKEKSINIENLGFNSENLLKLRQSLKYPNGIILLTGPTGSGKTTTLHSLIEQLDKEKLKIITIEDPVERKLEDINQIQVNEEIGLTFDSLLRRVLRQDPNVIMVGEIRDKETAELALKAALTGHLILATLHTNDSISAIDRLKNMNLDSYIIANVLRLSVAQRLVRKICPHCAIKVKCDSNLKNIFLQHKLKVPNFILSEKGCEKCNNTGFLGRTVISEVFVVDDKKAQDIIAGKKLSLEQKNSLFYDGLLKLMNGQTSLSELMREGIYIK